ncbi:hypothetical protein OAN61_00110 [bacterium]|nr:hypothetical protein [bacterium]
MPTRNAHGEVTGERPYKSTEEAGRHWQQAMEQRFARRSGEEHRKGPTRAVFESGDARCTSLDRDTFEDALRRTKPMLVVTQQMPHPKRGV